MNKNYQVSGKSKTLKHYANVDDTISAIQRIVKENYPAVRDLAFELEGETCEQTFRNIWNYVRNNIRYQNDESGKEQLRTPQRTLFDRLGDCDDMSILISSILINLGIRHELWVTSYKSSAGWQHIYPVAFSSAGNRYVIDCVPEIPYFNYEAQPIKNKIVIVMRLEELGQAVSAEMISELTQPFDESIMRGFTSELDELETIQGLLGNIAIVDEDEEYDTLLSGSELQKNIILKQLMDAKSALENELRTPSEMSQMNDNRTELILVNNIIENYEDDDELINALNQAIQKGTLYSNFYKSIKFALEDSLSGFAGDDDDDMYYLKVMDEQGMFDNLADEEMEGLGLFKKLRSKIKAGVQKFKEKHPKLAKVAHAVKKYNPATFAIRKSMDPFIRGNAFNMADKLTVGYATEAQAKNMGYSKAEWLEFVKAKDQAEQKWYSLGGEKDYFRKMIMASAPAKKAGIKGQLGVAPAVIAAVTKVFGAVINAFKNLKLKKKDGSIVDENPDGTPSGYTTRNTTTNLQPATEEAAAENGGNMETDSKTGVSVETVTDENGKESKVYKDKDGNEISKFKYFLLKNKTMIIIVAIILTVGIVALVIWKMRRRSMRGLGELGLSKKQENYLRRQGLNNRAYASLVREEIKKDKKPYNSDNRKAYYKKVFQDAFTRPLSEKQVSAAQGYNRMYAEVRKLAKEKGGGSQGWSEAWREVKKKA